ncbi:DUF4340 domain-containing protein [Oscillibacter sp. GMB15532]|uniref:DUF4340 domain-containing protein n=1 Tax=Oscillibacter sp. GMB15532 TaxID=3230022 RepID=UPI0034E02767
MKATKKTLFGLISALMVCIAGTLLLTYAGRGEAAADQDPTYYFTSYASPENVVLANLENSTGSVVLASVNGTCYAQGDIQLDADAEAILDFFNTVYQLPMKRLLDGADASDPQYGLTAPQAEILLQDAEQDGALFRVGNATPDGEGYYACLSGDARVFVMDRTYAQALLDNVDHFFDLSLYPSLDEERIGALRSLSVQRNGVLAYEVHASSDSKDSSSVILSMTAPYSLILGMNQARNEILMPLGALAGVDVIPQPDELSSYALSDRSNRFTLTYQDGTSAVIRVGKQVGTETYVLCEDSGLVLLVPTANLCFFYDTALEVVGQNLVEVSMGDLSSLQIGNDIYRISGTAPALDVTRNDAKQSLEEFQNGVYAALNRISLLGEWNGPTEGEPLLEMVMQTGQMDESLKMTYAFFPLEGHRCGVAVNGQPAFLCSQSAVQQLIDAAD